MILDFDLCLGTQFTMQAREQTILSTLGKNCITMENVTFLLISCIFNLILILGLHTAQLSFRRQEALKLIVLLINFEINFAVIKAKFETRASHVF